jgi:hypothetical protein
MGCEDKNEGPRVFSVRKVRGEPYQVGGRTLTPVTRIVSFGKASATIRNEQYGGWSGGLVLAMPIALLEETGNGEREIAVHDATFATLQRLSLVALGMTLFFGIVRWWSRHRRQAHSA